MNLLVFIFVYPLLIIISKLPFSVFYKVSDFVCFILYRLVGFRKKIVRKNLRLAFPNHSDKQLKCIERASYTNACDVFLEMIKKSMGMNEKEFRKRFKIKNIEVLTQFEKLNRSTILMCGHYANWERISSLGYYLKHPACGIYTPLANPYFDQLIQKARKKNNVFLISRYEAIKTIGEFESANKLGHYALLSDQSPHPKKKTYWRSFLGVNTPVFTGAERLAKEFDLPVVFTKIKRIKRGFCEVNFKLLTDTPKATKEYEITDVFTQWVEEQIYEDPTQYYWLHNRFKHSKI